MIFPRLLRMILLGSVLYFFSPLTFAQECGTEYSADPHFDRDAYETFLREYSAEKVSRDVELLPIQFNIIRHTDGTGGLDPDRLGEILDSANVYFAPAGIQFYSCGQTRFINENFLYDFDRGLYQDSLQARTTDNAINVFFINKVLNNASFICGYANFPWSDDTHVVVENRCAVNGSTFSHELGHYFGLLHTHETANGIEVVERTNCLFAGDELCDTPADPRLSGLVNAQCEYTSNHRDQNGVLYEPDPHNLMSYSRKECRNLFTEDQYARIRFYLEQERASQLSCELATPRKTDLAQAAFLRIFPNPSNTRLNLQLTHPFRGEIVVSLLDLQGKVVRSWREDKSAEVWEGTWELSELASGWYTLQAQVGSEQVYRKWVKE